MKSLLILALLSWTSLTKTIDLAWSEPPRLYINQTKVGDRYIEIHYEINFGGYVELNLKNNEGEMIWEKGVVVDNKGKHIFRIIRKPMTEGDYYSYTLQYKGREYYGSFTNAIKKDKEEGN